MRSGLSRVIASGLALSLLAAFAVAGAVEVAKARSSAGTATVTHAGKTSDVSSATEFQEGDVVRVPTDGRMTVEFGDGASIALVGPATMLFGPMGGQGRRVVLVSGAAPEVVVRGIALEVQAPSPYDASVVLQNAVGAARVNPGDRVTFQKLEGSYAKVWRAGQSEDLGANQWNLNVRDGVVSSMPRAAAGRTEQPAGTRSSMSEQPIGNDGVKLRLAGKTIIFHPAKSFSRETTADGGLRLCFQGGGEDWGVVEIGLETTLFLAAGQCVEFDANGNVVRFDGIAHVYRPLLDAYLTDEPIENATDASPSFSKKH